MCFDDGSNNQMEDSPPLTGGDPGGAILNCFSIFVISMDTGKRETHSVGEL
jgi:hypothetical protein